MKVTIMGSGSSSGTPSLSEGWGACDPENPRNRRLRPSLLIEIGTTTVLVDTSPDLRQQLLNAGTNRLDAILYTHGHADHLHGIDDLRGVNKAMNTPLRVFADAVTRDHIHQRFEYVTTPLDPDADFYYKPVLNITEISPGEGFSVGGMDIQAFDQDHGYTHTLGYRFGDFAYSTDLLGLPEESFQALEGVKTWIVDAFSWQPHRTHAHVNLALEWVERVKPARAVLTHLGTAIDYAELSAYVPEGVEVAYDGMVIEVVDDDNG